MLSPGHCPALLFLRKAGGGGTRIQPVASESLAQDTLLARYSPASRLYSTLLPLDPSEDPKTYGLQRVTREVQLFRSDGLQGLSQVLRGLELLGDCKTLPRKARTQSTTFSREMGLGQCLRH